MKRSLLPPVLIVASVTLAACGDDEPGTQAADEATATAAELGTDSATDTDITGFCEAHLAAEQAVALATAGGGDEAVGPAFEAMAASSPDELSTTVASVIELASAGEDEGPEFEDAYGELIGYVAANCGYPTLDVTAAEYQFDGLPDSVNAGPTVIALRNEGSEFHHIVLVRINDGVTEDIEELLELPDEEVFTKITPLGEASAFPGTTGSGVIDFQPGRHVALCFIPQGATPENMAAVESGEHQGAPHFTYGMVKEFEVS